MDDQRFDALSRLFAPAATRRVFSAALAGTVAALGWAGAGDVASAAKKQPKKKRCLKTGHRCTAHSGQKGDNCRRCCSGYSQPRSGGKGRRCACKAENEACTTENECCSRQCTGGECGACAPGTDLCPAGCVDLQTDPANCGACGTTCGNNQGCCAGTCADFTQPGTCGACDVTCAVDESCCDQSCVDVQTSDEHCGTCGNPCDADEFCDAGTCQSELVCGTGGPCIVFVSAGDVNGDMGGLASADALCQMWAGHADLPGTYMAWLSTKETSPSQRFTKNPGPYVLTNGTVVATSWSDLIDGTLAAPITIDEHEVDQGAKYVFTATTETGEMLSPGLTCDDWTYLSPLMVSVGASNVTDSTWTDLSRTWSCSVQSRLYCFQQS